jgi:apolipoprotein D and lipocalin family protein
MWMRARPLGQGPGVRAHRDLAPGAPDAAAAVTAPEAPGTTRQRHRRLRTPDAITGHNRRMTRHNLALAAMRTPTARHRFFARAVAAAALAAAIGATASSALAQAVAEVTPRPLPSLDLAGYVGTWHQVALIPNEFQRRCLADTQATYRQLDGGLVEVRNRCRTADGTDEVIGMARPRGSRIDGGRLMPASLEVAFAPTWLRWLPAVWGAYDVLALLDDGTISIVGEPSRTYLWVLSRKPMLNDEQWRRVDEVLRAQGYDPAKVVRG